jgi:SAM-dependent methyltransferase
MPMRQAPAAERNKDAILDVLRQVLPGRGLVLEIASGTGQHAVHFAAALTASSWQPSDPDPENRESIAAYVSASGIENVAAPIALDARDPRWPIDRADAVVCINMIHIAPWSAAEGLVRGAAGLLGEGKPFVLYGPFTRGGQHTAPSNADFDASLKRRDAEWGVRDLDDVTALAQCHGFELERVVAMPANNFTVVFRRRRLTDV